MKRNTLLFYCQHSLGMGHLVRSLALAARLSERFQVIFLNGGPLPKGMKVPDGVEIVNLPPLGLATDGQLISRDRRRTLERAQALRRRIILEIYRSSRPQVLFVELFPFGRKKFADELLPLLDEARKTKPARPLVCCSLRDILVGKKSNQQKHDERAVEIANNYFDAVMVHSDPSFARLEESLGSHRSLRIPVYHTGFVQAEETPPPATAAPPAHGQILVSAGGGLVGEMLFRKAIEAYQLLRQTDDVGMKIVTGPFIPAEVWQSLRASIRKQSGISLKRFIPDLCAEMGRSLASVSQGGYNTTLDILRAGVPSLIIPFAEGSEDEQSKRARRLEARGAVRVLDEPELTPARLADEMHRLLNFRPQRLNLDLNGARNTTRMVESLTSAHPQKKKRAAVNRMLCERKVYR